MTDETILAAPGEALEIPCSTPMTLLPPSAQRRLSTICF
jgi:hypothetical protein